MIFLFNYTLLDSIDSPAFQPDFVIPEPRLQIGDRLAFVVEQSI